MAVSPLVTTDWIVIDNVDDCGFKSKYQDEGSKMTPEKFKAISGLARELYTTNYTAQCRYGDDSVPTDFDDMSSDAWAASASFIEYVEDKAKELGFKIEGADGGGEKAPSNPNEIMEIFRKLTGDL